MALDRIVDLPRPGLMRLKRSFIALADRARDAGQWELAARLYGKALNRNPCNPPIWVQYGHALKESGDRQDPDKLAQAEMAYRKALTLDPGVADTYVQLGHVLKLQGKTNEAEASYLRAFALDPSMSYPLEELEELGWSEAHLFELRAMAGPDDSERPQPHPPNGSDTADSKGFGPVAAALLEDPRRADELLAATQTPMLPPAQGESLGTLAVDGLPETKRGADDQALTVKSDWADDYYRLKDRIAEQRRKRIEAFEERSVAPFKVLNFEEQLRELRFRQFPSPKISIIIPIYNEATYTLECLLSLAALPDCSEFEVILADDASSEDLTRKFQEIPNITYIRQKSGLGFLLNCNSVFPKCRGEYLLLLNNDAQLLPGCLDTMVAVLDADTNVAAVGPKLIYPNGRLQEAGCFIDRQGRSGMVGLFEDPDQSIYSYDREVQYCSGAALLVRMSELEGTLFDEAFVPMYCEDADLCLRFSAKAKKVIYCASATVVHHLSASTPVEAQPGKLQRIARNQQNLAEKWGDALRKANTVRIIAIYLPQFFPIPENDLWWGSGYTEWAPVARATPIYEGHYQPHLPADLGFYDLRIKNVFAQQARLARSYGLEGFCVYYYNFGTKRMLHQAFEAVVADPTIDFPFCVCWANENWTKKWDGGPGEILLTQDYEETTLRSVCRDFARYAADARYIRVHGRPMFLVYRPLLLLDASAFAALLRCACRDAGQPEPHLVYVESMEAVDKGVRPHDIGFDACVEFPPHGRSILASDSPVVVKQGWAGELFDYEETLVAFLDRNNAAYPRYPCVFPSWDNTARRPLTGDIFDGATPAAFQVYVEEKLDELSKYLYGDERLLFVNAWNEWGEGTHLEPDQRYGHGWLAAIRNALLAKEYI